MSLKAEIEICGRSAGCKCGSCPPRTIIVLEPSPPSKENPWGTEMRYLCGVDTRDDEDTKATGHRYRVYATADKPSAIKISVSAAFEWVHKLRKDGYPCHTDPPVKLSIKPVTKKPEE